MRFDFPVIYQECNCCNEIKHISQFHKNKINPNGYDRRCKECNLNNKKEYRKRKAELATKELRTKTIFNFPVIYKPCIECKEIKHIDRFRKHIGCKSGYLGKCIACVNKIRREKRELTPKDEMSPADRINHTVSRSMYTALKGGKGGRHWETLVGYSLKELMDHLELLFVPGMTWPNYGKYGWHIDHIIAKSRFNITSAECQAFKDCWALKNLQPLWAKDNLRKGAKLNY